VGNGESVAGLAATHDALKRAHATEIRVRQQGFNAQGSGLRSATGVPRS